MLLRTYSYGRIDPDTAMTRLAEYRKLHEERHGRLRTFFDEAASAPDEAFRTGALLTLKAGLLHEEAYIRWCDWATDFVRRARGRNPRASRKPR